jgi:hypothetical protein
MELPEPLLIILRFALETLPWLAGFVIAVMWILLPFLLLIRLGKIHDTLLRIERKGKTTADDNPFDL